MDVESMTAEQMAALIAKLRAEIKTLKSPTLFWVDEDPETGYCDHYEAREAALGWDSNGGVAAIREGRELGVRYYAVLPVADDSETDDEWEADFDNEADANAAIEAERQRRTTLARKDAN